SMSFDIPWVLTSHNFPPEDYISQYGSIKGRLLVNWHFSIMKKCKNIISCSKTIKRKLSSVNIPSVAIQNGIFIEEGYSFSEGFDLNLPRPIFISVGGLIPRKNMIFLINA